MKAVDVVCANCALVTVDEVLNFDTLGTLRWNNERRFVAPLRSNARACAAVHRVGYHIALVPCIVADLVTAGRP